MMRISLHVLGKLFGGKQLFDQFLFGSASSLEGALQSSVCMRDILKHPVPLELSLARLVNLHKATAVAIVVVEIVPQPLVVESVGTPPACSIRAMLSEVVVQFRGPFTPHGLGLTLTHNAGIIWKSKKPVGCGRETKGPVFRGRCETQERINLLLLPLRTGALCLKRMEPIHDSVNHPACRTGLSLFGLCIQILVG